ncbi:dehydratase [Lachnospiraceae bacterium ZAX-1]
MKSYAYDDIAIGQEESFEITITAEDMEMFRKITGDDNPLHCDDSYAKKSGYDGRVVYGMLTASYLSALAGMYLPGEKSLIYETGVKFAKPLVWHSGVNLTVCGKVVEKNDMFRHIIIKVSITDSVGTKILRETMKVGVTN